MIAPNQSTGCTYTSAKLRDSLSHFIIILFYQNGFTALVLASQAGHQDVVQALLKARARLNHQTKVITCMQGSPSSMFAVLATSVLLYGDVEI